MKKYFTIVFTLLAAGILSAQVSSEIILKQSYKDLPIQIKIENSGIYGVSHFEIKDGEISLFEFNSSSEYKFRNNKLIKTIHSSDAGNKFAGNFQGLEKPVFVESSESLYLDGTGLLKSKNGNKFEIEVNNFNTLSINYNSANLNCNFIIPFPGDLAYADLIGIDRTGNLFLVIERYLQQVPLKVKRQVYTVEADGNILSILNLPDIKYLYTLSDLQIDAEGNLYHLLTTADGIEIIKWTGLKKSIKQVITYPAEYDYHLHFNELLPAKEIKTNPPFQKVTDASRTMALRIGEGYVYHHYNCTSTNLAPIAVQAPDGDWVRTPDRLIVGANARVPYKWGGFQTLTQFDQGIAGGKYAGDIHTDGVSSYAVGVDCSGFVSRCWQLGYHASTSYMPNITNLYTNWAELKPSDAVHKVGHVRMYLSTNPNGRIKTVESTSAHGWGVVYWDFAPSDLTDYSPRYYTGMVDDYFENIVELKSVTLSEPGKVNITWACDDSDVIGYRIYRSLNGISWTLILDENTVQTKSAEDTLTAGTHYYRVSSVRNNFPIYTESDLSNMLGIGKTNSEKNYLIVDAFDRTSGSWRGPGHKFAARYGESIFKNHVNFESIKSNFIQESGINLSSYFALVWISGDESTVYETFSDAEQQFVKSYLESGGNLFVSGSEIGWDLDYNGSSSDKEFYNNYLKANYISDDAGSEFANGVAGTSMEGCSFQFGQDYEEDYPDEVGPFGGSAVCIKYANNKGAGIEYSGTFGTSTEQSRLIYFGFPLETTANDTEFDHVLAQVANYFDAGVTSLPADNLSEFNFSLSQNYPNPFNPTTLIKYVVGDALNTNRQNILLKVYDILGNEIVTLVNEEKSPGEYSVEFTVGGAVASGIYFYQLQVVSANHVLFSETKKLMLIK